MNVNRVSKVNPIVFIGGSGSSGSSLLSVILDRHEEIACGPELSAFNKDHFLNDFSLAQGKFSVWLKRGLKTSGYFYYYPFFCNKEMYGVSDKLLKHWMEKSESIDQFLIMFIKHYLAHQGKSIFAEKTPSNAYTFPVLSEIFPQAKFIHLYRDPRDVVCSLRKRGFTWFQASSMWLYNTAAALRMRGFSKRYFELSYENLVSKPEEVLNKLFDFLEVPYSPNLLAPHEEEREVEGEASEKWDLNPAQMISEKSVGRHKKEMTEFGKTVLYNTCLTELGAVRLGIEPISVTQVIEKLGYKFGKPSNSDMLATYFKLEQYYDWTYRSLKLLKRFEKPEGPLTRICI